MPGIMCNCGKPIKCGEIPNKNEWLLISDVEYDSFSGKIDAEELYAQMKNMLRCSNCGRIWIFWNGFENEPISYIPE